MYPIIKEKLLGHTCMRNAIRPPLYHSGLAPQTMYMSSSRSCFLFAYKYNFIQHPIPHHPNMDFSSKTMSILSIFIIFSSFPSLILCASKLRSLPLPSVTGPLAFAFDSKGNGPYTGVGDGRIVKYHGSKTGFVEYGYTSPIR